MIFDEVFKTLWSDVPGVDRNTNARLKEMARAGFVHCWNAAMDAAAEQAVEPSTAERILALKVK